MIDTSQDTFAWKCQVNDEDFIEVTGHRSKTGLINIMVEQEDDKSEVALTADQIDELAQALTLLAAQSRAGE